VTIEHGVDSARGRNLDAVRQSSQQALADLACAQLGFARLAATIAASAGQQQIARGMIGDGEGIAACLRCAGAGEAMESNTDKPALTAFERLFKERGLPRAIRSDNGVPFASPNGLFNLSRLSIWWLRLGVSIERIQPGHPQQNGRHERMHLTLKQEATRPAGANLLQQPAKFDDFLDEFNQQRPH
jgi:hypothetical protein